MLKAVFMLILHGIVVNESFKNTHKTPIRIFIVFNYIVLAMSYLLLYFMKSEITEWVNTISIAINLLFLIILKKGKIK